MAYPVKMFIFRLLSILSLTSLLLMLVSGELLIHWLKNLRGMKWSPREDTPDSHVAKAGTPSMGGIGIIGATFLSYAMVVIFFVAFTNGLLLFSVFHRNQSSAVMALLLPLMVIGHALLGFADDWSKARGKGGLLARQKLFGQIFLSIVFLLYVYSFDEQFFVGGLGSHSVVFDVGIFLFLLLLITSTSNAVNLTDGIDGLAAGLSVQCAVAFALLIVVMNSGFSITRWDISTLFSWTCIGGACLGFLAFNRYPAKVFMGDTGSLALGAALGAGAILTRSVFLLPFIGFIFFIEMFSVIIQVAYFKWTKKKLGEGKRLFRRAPLHHHFELGGWSEWRVVGTFWAVNLCTSAIGLVLWKMGILPRFP